ncbi:MAG: sodium/proline symporter PutP [Chitinispirillaceae bacterium]|nr:sodium/proline symporter PutP [Chitinispirillaceae bacterium]
MNNDTITILIPFVLYLAFMTGIGIFFYFRTKNLSDYILGGRKLNAWVTSMSAQASDMSGWLLLGLPGFAYVAGLQSIWIALGLVIGTYLNWKFVASRLRRYSEAFGNAMTLPVYFENRFQSDARVLRIVSAFFILVFFLIYTASGFVAGAKLFSTVFHLPYTTALLVGILVIIIYTFLGGFLAVAWTDFFQGLMMFCAIACVPVLAMNAAGGFQASVSAISSINPHLLHALTDADGNRLSVIAIVSLMAWGLGYFGQPHILARFMAIRKPELIRQSRVIAMVWVVVTLGSAIAVGLMGIALLGTGLGKQASETVFMVLVNDLVAPVVAGFLLAAILAAIMSTADSQLLVASSAITEDCYRIFFRKNATEVELVWISRSSVIAIAIIAFFIGLDPQSSVLKLVAYAWAGFGATFGPMILLSLFWKRMTYAGALAGIISGGLTVIIWKPLHGGVFDIYEIVPGFVVSAAVIIVTSLVDRPPLQSIVKDFERIEKGEKAK